MYQFWSGQWPSWTEFRNKIIHRKEQRLEIAKAKATKSKGQQWQLVQAVKRLRKDMSKPKYKLINKDLQLLIRYKKQKGDKPLPNRRKQTLQARWNAVKGRPSPQASPETAITMSGGQNMTRG